MGGGAVDTGARPLDREFSGRDGGRRGCRRSVAAPVAAVGTSLAAARFLPQKKRGALGAAPFFFFLPCSTRAMTGAYCVKSPQSSRIVASGIIYISFRFTSPTG